MDLAKTLKIDSVSRLHPTPPLRMGPTQTVAEAVRLMRQEKVGCLLVCEGEKLVGILSLGDIASDTDEELSGEILGRVSEPTQPSRRRRDV